VVATASVPRVRFVRVRRAGSERRLAVLDPETRDRYRRLVARSAGAVEAGLSDAVVANRVSSWRLEPPELRLRPWRAERRIFAARLISLSGRAEAIAFADVHRCFASIPAERVGQALRRLEVDAAEEVEGFLRDLESDGVRGLPVGPPPSAVLANAVLAALDSSLEGAGVPHLRWVDDVVLAAADASAALDLVRSALGRIGLRLNERKTRVIADPGAFLSRTRTSPSR
jgi:Reverse transcriptase (RNA-dependent DNA polymerase)